MYIGTKIVTAEPMTRGQYNEFRGWPAGHGSDMEAEGYLVEYLDTKPNIKGRAGYVSWSPKAVFDAAYRLVDSMTFGMAIEALKMGKRVARAGWNGKGMWLSLSCGEPRDVPAEAFWSPHNAEHARQQGGMAKVLPSITMKTATGEILMGWLASQSDMLAEDWQIVD